MRNNLVSVGFLMVCTLWIILSPVNSSPSSFRDDVQRSRRQAAVAAPTDKNETSVPEPEPEGDCAALDRSKCKSNSCPKDDKTVELCCNCLQTCCVSENGTMMESVSNGTELNLTSTTPSSDVKSKISEAAGKVGGFFKNVGQSIKHGLDSGWDKVKNTANDVKETVRKGVNTGSDWVRNKTTASDNPSDNKQNANLTCGGSNCTSDMIDGDTKDNMNSSESTPSSSVTQSPPKKAKRSNSDSDNDSDEVKQYSPKNKNKVKISGSTSPGSSNKESAKDSDVTENSTEEEDPLISSSNKSKSKLKSAQEKEDKYSPQSGGGSEKASTSDSTSTRNNSTTNRKPVPGMHKSRKRRQVQGSYNYQHQHDSGNMADGSTEHFHHNHPPSWSSSGSGLGPGYGYHSSNAQGNVTTATMTSGTVSSMGATGSKNWSANQKLRKRRDVPPGMMAERSKLRKMEEEERRKNDNNTMMTTPDMGSKVQRSRPAPVGDETEMKMSSTMPPSKVSSMNDKDGSSKVRSKREPAGPPSNSQNMRTTTATPAMLSSTKETFGQGRRQRRASENKPTTKLPPITSTIDPLGGDETNSSTSMTVPSDEDTATKPPPTSGKGTHVWITVSSNTNTAKDASPGIPSNNAHNVGSDLVLVPVIPIRAPGSVNPKNIDEISHKKQKKSEGSSLIDALRPSSGISHSEYPLTGRENVGTKQVQEPSPLPPDHSASVPASDDIQSKPGRCRPLSQGLQCVSLGRDSAQCKDDAGCEGSKKCCFYSCKPNSDIGICEHPIFS